MNDRGPGARSTGAFFVAFTAGQPMPQSRDLKAIKADMLSVYDWNADAWEEGRNLGRDVLFVSQKNGAV